MSLGETPSQTIGPFFAVMLQWADGAFVVPDRTPGGFWLRGVVLDGAGDPVPDALVEVWQANPDGEYGADGFRGFGRSSTDADGGYGIWTVKPGSAGAGSAPHLAMTVFARGLIDRVVTRVYFPDEPDANAADPVLSGITDPEARATLVARQADDGFRFDIHLQGAHETVFFAT
jgi:protocatechuate 3,4-dioxygenase, alpha subunit